MISIKRALILLVAGAALLLSQTLSGQSSVSPKQTSFYGPAAATIASGVVIPAGRAVVWTSGTTPPLLRPDMAAGARERFGDTRAQAAGILRDIEMQLGSQGLSFRDVVYLRAYLVPDPLNGGRIDLAGWNTAYGNVFGTAVMPVKPARSTVGVVALGNPEWLVEIEAFAVYPR